MRKFDSYLPFVPTQKEAELFISSLRVWKAFKNSLYEKDWCPYIKETFNGFGNAIEYLGRYTHRVAISNNRILSVTETEVTFSARGKSPVTQNGRSPSATKNLSAGS
ncbi:MAG: transposase [Lacrimispora saccharolytica]